MTENRMALLELLEKGSDGDVVRASLDFSFMGRERTYSSRCGFCQILLY
jgi:hypothetical protein